MPPWSSHPALASVSSHLLARPGYLPCSELSFYISAASQKLLPYFVACTLWLNEQNNSTEVAFRRVPLHFLYHSQGSLAFPNGSCRCGQYLKKNLETPKALREGKLHLQHLHKSLCVCVSNAQERMVGSLMQILNFCLEWKRTLFRMIVQSYGGRGWKEILLCIQIPFLLDVTAVGL